MSKSKEPGGKQFWQKLPKPFFALAPMEDVTDTVFRQIVAKAAKPDVFFTEFTNVDGLMSPGREKLIGRLKFTKKEQPIIAQIWGVDPQNFYQVSKMVNKMGFDGIDINMGCPQKDVVKIGACSALIKDHKKAGEIIAATKEGAGQLPVSVKTRLGFSSFDLGWLQFLLAENLDALTIHGRTVAEMSKPPARWDEIGRVVEMRDQMGSKTIIIGNGDIRDFADGAKKYKQYAVDGIMVGRGIFSNLWAFEKESKVKTWEERKKLLKNHIKLFQNTWGTTKNPQILKKYFKIYVSGFEGASDMRSKLMGTKDYNQMINILEGKIYSTY